MMMKRLIVAGCAASILATAAMLGAQTPNPPEVTVSGCLAKNAKSQYTLTDAKIEKAAPGAPATTTWVIDVDTVAASDLGLDGRVGQRLEVVGRMNAEASKSAGATLQIHTLKQIAGTCP
jgi:hypothetical protein